LRVEYGKRLNHEVTKGTKQGPTPHAAFDAEGARSGVETRGMGAPPLLDSLKRAGIARARRPCHVLKPASRPSL